MSQLLYSVPEVASVLSLSERLIWKLVRTGDIKSFKIGAARRVERKAIDDYLSIMR
jgi:excisionase family DNA binding protein